MWGAIIGVILALGKMAYGAYQRKKAKDEAGAAPMYQISDQYYNNLGLAQSELSQGGFSSDALNSLYQANQQNLLFATQGTILRKLSYSWLFQARRASSRRRALSYAPLVPCSA